MKKFLTLYLFSSLALAAPTNKDNRSIAYEKYHLYPEFQNYPALLSRLERRLGQYLYFELADLLLQAAKSNPTLLKAAIDNIELFKQLD
jgi:hypothetical protein